MRSLAPAFFLLALLSAHGCGKVDDKPDPACRQVDCGAHGTCSDGTCECRDDYVGALCQFPPSCVPQCSGKECGDNGCGGFCGLCPANKSCTDGQCGCDDSCTTRECGNNDCGNSCGECTGGAVCDPEGRCCNRDCAGKTCGDDGCGGSCGTCTGANVCIQGQCGVDSGLGCIIRTQSCTNDGDCTGVEDVCRAPPKMACSRPVSDCGSETTVCKSLRECWKSCSTDADCAGQQRGFCLDGVCQACRDDVHCANGLPCVNNNARLRCASPDDCPTFAAELCI